jgi:hypothetical protein
MGLAGPFCMKVCVMRRELMSCTRGPRHQCSPPTALAPQAWCMRHNCLFCLSTQCLARARAAQDM